METHQSETTSRTKGADRINTQLISREASVTGRYAEMDGNDFVSELEKTWKCLEDVKTTLQKHVSNGNLKPIDAIRGFSALSSNILGYEEFVPRGNQSPLTSFSQQ